MLHKCKNLYKIIFNKEITGKEVLQTLKNLKNNTAADFNKVPLNYLNTLLLLLGPLVL